MTITLDRPVDVAVAEELTSCYVPDYTRCDFRPCWRPAVLAVTFKGFTERDHSHVCKEHEAAVREFYDIDKSAPFPCPFQHYEHVDCMVWAPKLEA